MKIECKNPQCWDFGVVRECAVELVEGEVVTCYACWEPCQETNKPLAHPDRRAIDPALLPNSKQWPAYQKFLENKGPKMMSFEEHNAKARVKREQQL